jgi:glutamyl-tRNA synthetase
LKSDGFPTYHLANVIDDHFMEISHVLRAEEWIPSAPLHKLLYQAFGWEMPQIAHLPVILAPDGSKISKRKHPEAAISFFYNGGYLPEAVTNFLCNVGWNYGVKDENGEEIQIFTKEQAAEIFDVSRVTNTGTKFDLTKLQWLNGEYIRLMDDVELAKRLKPVLEKAGYEVNVDLLIKMIPLIKERMKLLTDVVELAGFMFSGEIKSVTAEALIPKKMTAEQTRDVLQKAHAALAALPEFNHAAMESVLRPMADQLGLKPGPMFTPIRVAVTGQPVSPPLFETMELIGRDVSLKRIEDAATLLK